MKQGKRQVGCQKETPLAGRLVGDAISGGVSAADCSKKYQDIFDSLTRNAFDFLQHAVAEFDRAPKYSVIHFCSAIEMLLKARLMQEHWSLIVSKPDQADLAKFKAGDFISVTLQEARARIRNIANEDIGDEAYASFRTLANHRNKVVHFFHHGLESDQTAKEAIVAEQCRAWFHLHRLLHGWDTYFHDFGSEIARADKAMKKHQQYLAAKFQALTSELEARRKAGKAPKACSACGFEAAIPDAIDDQIASLSCLVCDHTEVQVELECPHCSQSMVIANGGFANCEHCGKGIEPAHLVDALTDHAAAHIAFMDGGNSLDLGNCSNCDGYQTVVRRGESYFCTDCFEVFAHIEQCDWCGDLNTGDMEHSYWSGCNHCDGKADRDKDD